MTKKRIFIKQNSSPPPLSFPHFSPNSPFHRMVIEAKKVVMKKAEIQIPVDEHGGSLECGNSTDWINKTVYW